MLISFVKTAKRMRSTEVRPKGRPGLFDNIGCRVKRVDGRDHLLGSLGVISSSTKVRMSGPLCTALLRIWQKELSSCPVFSPPSARAIQIATAEAENGKQDELLALNDRARSLHGAATWIRLDQLALDSGVLHGSSLAETSDRTGVRLDFG